MTNAVSFGDLVKLDSKEESEGFVKDNYIHSLEHHGLRVL